MILGSISILQKNNSKTSETSSSPVVIKGYTMGTYYAISYIQSLTSSPSPKQIKDLIESDLDEINRQMSTYRTDSEISQFNQHHTQASFPISAWFQKVLRYSLLLAEQSQGYFDPTVGPLVNLWGFGPIKATKRPSVTEINNILPRVGYTKINLNKDGVSKQHSKLYLDLSSVAKGFAVDVISRHLTRVGLRNHLVDIGGEIIAQGKKNSQKHWLIGIEKPQAKRSLHTLIILNNQAIATSGDYRNFHTTKAGTITHTINPKTGQAHVTTLVSVSVLSKTCMTADALATALLVMGKTKAQLFAKKHQLAVMFIIKQKDNIETIMTPGFQHAITKDI